MSGRLTKQKIDKFAYAGGWDVRWDSDVTGLGVRLYPTGKKSFVLSYRLKTGSKPKRLIVLGPVGVITVDQARSIARLKLAEVIQGGDPVGDRGNALSTGSFGDYFAYYLEWHAKPHKKSWHEDYRRFHLHVPKKWLARSPVEITREEVRALHVRLGARSPYEANRILALLRVMFNFARKSGAVPESHPNPASEITPFREQPRARYASPEEVKVIAASIDEEPNVHVRALIWLYLLTGARRSELLHRKWAEVDRERCRIRLEETKSGDQQFLLLSPPAMAILDALPKVSGNPFIFPGSKPGKHFVNISKPWKRILQRAGVHDLRLHDLRRTVGSWMSQDGVELNTVKNALRHRNISTTLVYARLHDGVAADAFERHGRRIMQIGGDLRLTNPSGQ